MRAPAALALLLSACAPDLAGLRLEVTESGTVMVIGRSATGARVRVFEVDAARERYVGLPDPAPNEEVYALRYRCGLAELGLPEAELGTSTEAPPESYPLPIPASAVRLEDGGFANVEPPPEVQALRLDHRAPSRCVELEEQFLELGPLVAMLAHSMFELPGVGLVALRRDGVILQLAMGRATEIARATLSTHSCAAARDDQGRIFVLEDNGGVLRGSLTGPWDRLPPAPIRPSAQAWMAASADGESLYVVDQYGQFLAFEGGQWASLNPPAENLVKNGAVLWRGPRDVLFMAEELRSIFEWNGSTLRPSRSVDGTGGGVSAMALAGEYGLVVGTTLGAMSWSYEGTFRGVGAESAVSGEPVLLVMPIDRGLLYGGSKGVVGQHHPGFGECKGVSITSAPFESWHALEGGYVMSGTMHGDGPTPRGLTFLRRKSAPIPDCARWPGEQVGL